MLIIQLILFALLFHFYHFNQIQVLIDFRKFHSSLLLILFHFVLNLFDLVHFILFLLLPGPPIRACYPLLSCFFGSSGNCNLNSLLVVFVIVVPRLSLIPVTRINWVLICVSIPLQMIIILSRNVVLPRLWLLLIILTDHNILFYFGAEEKVHHPFLDFVLIGDLLHTDIEFGLHRSLFRHFPGRLQIPLI